MRKKTNEYKIATTIWLLSCNDKIPQMTFESVRRRVKSSEKEIIKMLVSKFPELYQEEIPIKQFNEWKTKMKEKELRPKWIAQSQNQDELIDNLSLSEVFRNRFRNSIEAAPIDIEIINWGLAYLREFYSFKKEGEQRRLLWISSFVIPLVSVILAGFSIYFSYQTSKENLLLEREKIENTFMQNSYSTFLHSLNNIRFNDKSNAQFLNAEFSNANAALIELSQFISKEDFKSIETQLLEYMMEVEKIVKTKQINDEHVQSEIEKYLSLRTKFTNTFIKLLKREN